MLGREKFALEVTVNIMESEEAVKSHPSERDKS